MSGLSVWAYSVWEVIVSQPLLLIFFQVEHRLGENNWAIVHNEKGRRGLLASETVTVSWKVKDMGKGLFSCITLIRILNQATRRSQVIEASITCFKLLGILHISLWIFSRSGTIPKIYVSLESNWVYIRTESERSEVSLLPKCIIRLINLVEIQSLYVTINRLLWNGY